MTMTTFHIMITADTICPWVRVLDCSLRVVSRLTGYCSSILTHVIQCYLTKVRLERAIAIYKRVIPWAADDFFFITWHPFTLDSTLPQEGVDTKIHLERKFGKDRVAFATALLGVVWWGKEKELASRWLVKSVQPGMHIDSSSWPRRRRLQIWKTNSSLSFSKPILKMDMT